MIEQFVYVLATERTGTSAEMTFVSASLLRRLYHGARIVLIVDTVSHRLLQGAQRAVLDVVDSIELSEVGDLPSSVRSRYLKTQMRQLVKGPFIYLDLDALPLRRFDRILGGKQNLSAALDRNATNPRPVFPSWVIEDYRAMGWKHPVSRYFNSGVLVWGDSAAAHDLGVAWHQHWKALLAARQQHRPVVAEPCHRCASTACGHATNDLQRDDRCIAMARAGSEHRAFLHEGRPGAAEYAA
jgi:hypothetical protein